FLELLLIKLQVHRGILANDMEFLKTIKKRRSLLSEAVYVALNVGIAILLMITIRTTGSFLLAFAIVLIGKWRIFAVRPRFWFANIQANLVSIIVSISFVVLLYVAGSGNASSSQVLIVQSLLVLLDIIWLLFLKSQSKRVYIVAQASIALFVGITSIFYLSYNWVASVAVVLAGLVGYASAKHVLGSYDDESHTVFLSLVWGLVIAEISWLAFYWTIAYQLPFVSNILLPQVSIIVLCFGFLTYKSYDSFYHHKRIRINDILLPLIFTISIVSVLILFFNGVSTGVS
ncbi:MAG TPA: hypothetical protein VMR16_03190, partial [Candidatus Saccharimonadales bacterium]|nr:hypothetical protein [Candidatus Saccharimonadales bacterium]